MTEKQIDFVCDMGYDHEFRKKMLNLVMDRIGPGRFLVIKKDGSLTSIPRSAIYNTCIVMIDSTCFYIDPEKGLSYLELPFKNRTAETVTKEEKAEALAYAETRGIKMPSNFRSLFIAWTDIVYYTSPCKNVFPEGKEQTYFAAALSSTMKAHKRAFFQKIQLPEKDFCDEIVYGYNKRILNNMVFCEAIRDYPEKSPVCKMADRAFRKVGKMDADRPRELWIKENVTPSMDEADYRLFKAVTSIKKPKYEKATGNKAKRTFDTIRVWFSLVSRDLMPDRNAFIKENREGFARLALACIQDDRRCSIPVNLLKIDHIGITSQSQLEFIFSLKDEVIAAFE